MTIEEARMKECRQIPVFMQSTSNANLIDAGSVQFIPSKCSANECMAWRWYYEAIPDSEKSSEITAEFLFARTLGVPEMRMSKTNGYCGLAGKEGAE